MAAHLWTDAPAPWEYVRLVLGRDVYHCRPDEVDNVSAQYVIEDLAMLSIENKVNKQRTRK
ncbi:MAG: hypothetical protein PHQ36_05860 [Anaerolineales bacterium]|nr:hypothetical protein [Anaerolineales bacterium]